MPPALSTERIAHLGTAGDCRAAAFQSSLCRSWVIHVDFPTTAIRRLQPLRYLHDCSGCFRLERLPAGACAHWKPPPCHGARHERTHAVQQNVGIASSASSQSRCSILPDPPAGRAEIPVIAMGSTGAIGGHARFIVHILSVQAHIARLSGPCVSVCLRFSAGGGLP